MKSKALSALLIAALVGLPTLCSPALSHADDTTTEQDRIRTAGTVLKEIMDIPDNIPQSLIDKADCVIVYPSVLKAAFVVGVSYGRGVMTCRSGPTFHGPWSAPSMMALEGASFGLQAGGQATDFVILVMNTAGANARIYGKPVSARDIVLHGAVRPTPDAKLMLDTLRAHSPKNLSK